MPAGGLAAHAQEALFLTSAVSMPVVLAAAAVGLVVAAFQAASQIQDPTLAHLPRFLGVVVALVVFGPWMAQTVGAFAQQMFAMAAR